MDAVNQRLYPPHLAVPLAGVQAGLATAAQETLAPRRRLVVLQGDGGGALTIQAVVGHVQREDVGVVVVQRSPPQHKVHAIAAGGGGGRVQDQCVVLEGHGTPALQDTHAHTLQ